MLIKSQKNHSVPLGQSLILVLLLTGAVVVLLPLVIVFLTSLTPASATSSGSIWPKAVTLANYQEAWQRGGFLLAFANSTFVALTVTGFQIITSALAGYALARLKFRGRQVLLLIVLATLVIPFQILVKGLRQQGLRIDLIAYYLLPIT